MLLLFTLLQSKCQTSASWARPTTPSAPTSALGSWRSWRRNSTSASTWRGRAAWRSPPRWSWTKRRWRSGSRTDAWSRRSASVRAPPRPVRAPPPPPPPRPSRGSWTTRTTRPPPRLRARRRVPRRRRSAPRERCQVSLESIPSWPARMREFLWLEGLKIYVRSYIL